MEKTNPNMMIAEYFNNITNPLHRQYLALRMFLVDGFTAEAVAAKFGYSISSVYSMVRDFRKKISNGESDPFFKDSKVGRKKLDRGGDIKQLVVSYRKKYMSVPEIKSALDAQGIDVSERYISMLLSGEGFARLPRRDNKERRTVLGEPQRAPKSKTIDFQPEVFSSQLAGLLLFLPIIRRYGIDEVIQESTYPETGVISRLSSILSFLALKLSDVGRYSMDDAWCMDRGMGLFAGLNVLPKTAWFSSYSSGITRDMNLSFLQSLHGVWVREGLLSDTVNLDFTAIPYWGDDDPFENNWSGKRSKALASIQAVLAQDSDSGLLCYSDTTIRHSNESDVILEFLDFYHTKSTDNNLRYLVFDSKFTTYQNLNRLSQQGVSFVTIQRRSKKLQQKIDAVSPSNWKTIRVMQANGKGRRVKAFESTTPLSGYDGVVRQVIITGTGKIKPAIIITNDFNISLEDLIRKYSRRWLIEKQISEQVHFFHLNRNSSGIVVKVDFDLVMTLLAHNLYRLFVRDIDGYSHCEAKTIFNKFILNAGEVTIYDKGITVGLKKKRTLPLILDQFSDFAAISYPWLGNKVMAIIASNST